MTSEWKETFLLWSKMEEFLRKKAEAENIISEALQFFKKPYVAFSGGKDSTCVLSLVLKQKSDVMVFHWDYGRYVPRWVEWNVRKNAKRIGTKNLRTASSKRYQYTESPVWYKVFFGAIVPALIKEGFDSVFVGLRKEESSKRKRRVKEQQSLTQIKEFFPVGNWSWMDVWAYILSEHLPYPTVYDMYAKVEGWDKVRFSTFFDPEMDKFGCSNVDGVLLWKFKNKK